MVRKTDASGQRMAEAKHINKSLSALGNVINALTAPGQQDGSDTGSLEGTSTYPFATRSSLDCSRIPWEEMRRLYWSLP